MTDFAEFFSRLTGRSPYPWQAKLAEAELPSSRVVRIPTGFGKTAAVVATWSYHRAARRDPRWPRRLVFCLPMRVLVEQVEGEIGAWLKRLDLLWDGQAPHEGRVGVHVLMGGVGRSEWHLHPEHDSILIGTQDMLLSRALNRGYGSARGRWPMEFAQLHQDALWIFDEVQLMDVGLATSIQLEAFRATEVARNARPSASWWMSATLQPAWLRTVDAPRIDADLERPLAIDASDRRGGFWDVQKRLDLVSLARPERGARDTEKEYRARVEKSFAVELATLATRAHGALPDGPHGRITLVVVNTVARARAVHEAIVAGGSEAEIELVHSRFRMHERAAWRDRFLARERCVPGANRIIVATQVVEAGVDISAGALVTDLAPWPSLVQRFGRAARYLHDDGSTTGHVIVVDRGLGDDEENAALPYSLEELRAARNALDTMVARGLDCGIAGLEALEQGLDEATRGQLFPYDPLFVLRRRDFDELFDTTPDLMGADLDISRFIRSGEERDVQVFWRVASPEDDGGKQLRPPHRDELCTVPAREFREWLDAKGSDRTAYVHDYLDGVWRTAGRRDVIPGRTFLVLSACGGYDLARGWVGSESKSAVPEVPLEGASAPLPQTIELLAADDTADDESLTEADRWQTIAGHGQRVGWFASVLGKALASSHQDVLDMAGRWHDYGKAHAVFQESIVDRTEVADRDGPHWAKAPAGHWSRRGHTRAGFRHELASMLALLDLLARSNPTHDALAWPWATERSTHPELDASHPLAAEIASLAPSDFDLLLWLVATHHGKVRARLMADPRDSADGDRSIRGVKNQDALPSIELSDARGTRHTMPALECHLDVAAIGLSPRYGRSWVDRLHGLLERHGPFTLAYLETLLRVADIRASRDPGEEP